MPIETSDAAQAIVLVAETPLRPPGQHGGARLGGRAVRACTLNWHSLVVVL